jgi:hypothetical protein
MLDLACSEIRKGSYGAITAIVVITKRIWKKPVPKGPPSFFATDNLIIRKEVRKLRGRGEGKRKTILRLIVINALPCIARRSNAKQHVRTYVRVVCSRHSPEYIIMLSFSRSLSFPVAGISLNKTLGMAIWLHLHNCRRNTGFALRKTRLQICPWHLICNKCLLWYKHL